MDFRSPSRYAAVKLVKAFMAKLGNVYESPSPDNWPKLEVFDQLSEEDIGIVQKGWAALKELCTPSEDPKYAKYLIGNDINDDDFQGVINDVRFTGIKDFFDKIKFSIDVVAKMEHVAMTIGNYTDVMELLDVSHALNVRLGEAIEDPTGSKKSRPTKSREIEFTQPYIEDDEEAPNTIRDPDAAPDTLRTRVAKRLEFLKKF